MQVSEVEAGAKIKDAAAVVVVVVVGIDAGSLVVEPPRAAGTFGWTISGVETLFV